MIPGVTAPLVCLLALQEGTKIVLYKYDGSKEIINIPKGSMFIMSGDCLHGGFSHVVTNARLHWYLEAIDLVTAIADQTGWLKWSKKKQRWKPNTTELENCNSITDK